MATADKMDDYPRDLQLLADADASACSLNVRRFCERLDRDRPIDAINDACMTLLERYCDRYEDWPVRISVWRLCGLLDVDVRGPKPVSSHHLLFAAKAPYSDGCTGAMSLKSGRPLVRLPLLDERRARLSLAHELGHVLMHRHKGEIDSAGLRLGYRADEEALAEYAARLLLLPGKSLPPLESNLCRWAADTASNKKVTLHAACARLLDPDLGHKQIRGAILWKMDKRDPEAETPLERLKPHWHLCPSAFIPIRRCRSRQGSLIAHLGLGSNRAEFGTVEEDVTIGSLIGHYLVDVFAWGSVEQGTRHVLSFFRD